MQSLQTGGIHNQQHWRRESPQQYASLSGRLCLEESRLRRKEYGR